MFCGKVMSLRATEDKEVGVDSKARVMRTSRERARYILQAAAFRVLVRLSSVRKAGELSCERVMGTEVKGAGEYSQARAMGTSHPKARWMVQAAEFQAQARLPGAREGGELSRMRVMGVWEEVEVGESTEWEGTAEAPSRVEKR